MSLKQAGHLWQRKGMGHLEYHTMPSLREVAHDGFFVYI
jgi:hypothetical protein